MSGTPIGEGRSSEGYKYEVHDFIAEHNARCEDIEANPEKWRGLLAGLPTQRVWDPAKEVYPQKDHYTFQEFAGPVFELGGYGDMTLIDPYSQRRLWVADVLKDAAEQSIYDAMITTIKIAQEIGFLGSEEEARANYGSGEAPTKSLRDELTSSAAHARAEDRAWVGREVSL